MRIRCRIIGNFKSFYLVPELEKGVGWDTKETIFFASSLCSSLSREMTKLADQFNQVLMSNEAYQRSSDSIARGVDKGRFGYVLVDVYSKRIKGKPMPFCKISIEEGDADVRTINTLPEIARFVYKTIWLLKRTAPPDSMDILRQITVERAYHDPKAKTHELYIKDGTVYEREKTLSQND